MTPERWRHVTEVFHAALARDASARARYLDQACAGDGPLREEVDAMLAAHLTSVDTSLTYAPRLAAGAMVGPYRVTELLGAGGMGEVYRARDTKLGRDVAIKVLPTAFTSDSERLARLEREARLLAALNHPHIAAIHGLEEAQGVRALVLELVEGETLGDRIERGALRVGEALAIGRQVAEALEEAHAHGIIHRDLKPANVKVTPAGVVKVLDFGLAKAFVGDGSGPEVLQLPTITVEGTREGVIAGSVAYMSPEQARGKTLDKRTDIWAFGCVLYEMLTGTLAFAGDDASDTLARVLMSEPDWDALPRNTPPAIRKLLRRCLAKDRRERLSDAGDARLEIDETLTTSGGDAVPATTLLTRVPLWRRAVAPALALVLGGVIVVLAVSFLPPDESPLVVRSTITPTGATALEGGDMAISPDGTRLAYVGGNRQIFVAPSINSSQRRSRVWTRQVTFSSHPTGSGLASSMEPARSRKSRPPVDLR